uniref:Putative 6-phosphofructo-2-kinase/fructose-2,6-bisphosphatase n=1 Tax=Lygus hesperus TaxID=30085 RepID=A0A0A9YXE0_LYGHE
MPSRLAYMLHNLSHTPACLYLTRPGEYVDMVTGHIGGNSRLTARGEAYAMAVYDYFKKELPPPKSFSIMSSCSKRCVQTVSHFFQHNTTTTTPTSPLSNNNNSIDEETNKAEDKHWPRTIHVPKNNTGTELNFRVAFFPTLDNINHGDCEGLRFEDVYRTMPSTLQAINADPYYTAWPNGECIHQVYNSRL